MAAMLLLALSPTAVALSPSTALDAWRSNRLTRWSRTLDRRFDSEYTAFGRPRTDLRYGTTISAACLTLALTSTPTLTLTLSLALRLALSLALTPTLTRYRMQVLVVDHSGLRGRLCEAVLDLLCEDVDAAVDTMTSSIGPAVQRPGPAVCEAGARLGLSRLPLEAGARRLRPEDLLAASRWDLVVCVDLEVLELVREMAREANAITASSGESSRPAAPKRRAEGAYEPAKQDRARLRGHDGIGVTRTILCMTDFLVRLGSGLGSGLG